MSLAVHKQSKLLAFANAAQAKLTVIVFAALVVSVVAVVISEETIRFAFFAMSGSAIAFSVMVFLICQVSERYEASIISTMNDVFENDTTPVFLSNSNGELVFHNAAAARQLPARPLQTIASALSKTLANPSTVLRSLQSRATSNLSAEEDIVTGQGIVRINVHRIGSRFFFWRIENTIKRDFDPGTLDLPMILVGVEGKVLHLNRSAMSLVGSKSDALDDIFVELPEGSGTVARLANVDLREQVYVSILDAGAGRRAFYLLPTAQMKDSTEDWSVFHNLPVPLLNIASNGHVRAFNRMAASLVGKSLRKDVHLSELMEGLGRPITDWLQETLAGKGGPRSEFLRLKRVDKEAFVQVSLNRVTEREGPSLIAVLNDATELKTLEAQFVQSQKMQAIGQLAGGVAHDFNDLLTAISGHCDLLLLRHDEGDPDFSDLVQINQNANRAAALVGQLLAFSRKQTLRPEVLDMRETLSDLTHLLNRLVGEKVTLSLQHDPVLQPIRADKRQLEQVLMNLVVNARDAMPHGGEIRIITEVTHVTEPLERDQVKVPAGDYVTVQVFDDGVGIPSDKLQKVFEPFFTTKRTGEGTGLGLSTAYGIVKQTGGYIFVDSTLGSGTCFTLYFPVLEVEEPKPTETLAEPIRNSGVHGDGVILLVEDEAPVRAFASRALRLRGYTVLEAESAEAALKTLEDDTLHIDVIVTDVVMPGMDGPSWVRKALKKRPDVRVVFVSGYAEDSFSEAQMKIPNSVFLPKPFSLNDLTDTVNQQMH